MGKLDEILEVDDAELEQAIENLDNDETEEAQPEPETKEETIPLSQLESLQKERDGLLKGMKEERKKRQEFQSRLDVLTGTVNAILEKRSKGDAEPKGAEKLSIVLETDEDGNDILPVEKLEAVLSPYKQEIENLRQMISAQHNLTQAQTEKSNVLQQILSEDESYPKAYNKYTQAREWANTQVVEWQKDNGWSGPMSGEQAMDLVFEGELEAQFQNQFPGADLEAVVGQSKRSLRKALKSLAGPAPAEEETVEEKKPDSRFQKVLQKPSGLSGARNVRSGATTVTEKLSTLSFRDISDLSDKEVAALQEALLAEERSDGVKF